LKIIPCKCLIPKPAKGDLIVRRHLTLLKDGSDICYSRHLSGHTAWGTLPSNPGFREKFCPQFVFVLLCSTASVKPEKFFSIGLHTYNVFNLLPFLFQHPRAVKPKKNNMLPYPHHFEELPSALKDVLSRCLLRK